ncbi:MAG TPA: bifunctional 4-hydroxy-2-oxoglutarate aldolase/2-dehydro-3-deoxy-phosphogluconate aldolase [Vicinamibacterales bacterium]|nr:bifunctional 4-hydroxy-2-oxoglutarate aldolase/2-dehydro-3-deoxy-phosphogluconate aldolase [Vicinamibacterales bacterium]
MTAARDAHSDRAERRTSIAARIEELGAVAVVRMKDAAKVHAIVDALAAGGVRALEVTMTVPRAVELIGELSARLPAGFLLGAGTVVDARTAHAVIDSGATFVVSPVFRPEVIDACHERDVPAIPGCFTPTEILGAHDAGADLIKVFPATALGPQYLKDVLAPLPQVKLVPTGGVTVHNAGDWIRAGAAAVGIGSALLDATAIAAGRYQAITALAEDLVANVAAARSRATG